MTHEDTFLEFWNDLGPKPSTTLRCFERGDVYTLHGSDALIVAKEYFGNVSIIKHYTKGRVDIPYVTVKKTNVDFLRHFLLKHQYRIEIYYTPNKSGSDWILKLKASPGNLSELEDLLIADNRSLEVMGLSAISLKWRDDQLYASVGFCDKDRRRFLGGEFADSVQLANLETALVQLESRECLVPAWLLSSSENRLKDPTIIEHLKLIFDRVGLLVTEVEKSDFSLTDASRDLNYLLCRSSGLGQQVASTQPGLDCLGAIVKFLDLKSDSSNASAFTLEQFNLDDFVRLDSAATRALHLLPSSDDRNRYQCVFGVLNHCRTQQGQRLLAQWLRQPLTDIHKINDRLDLVEAFINESGVRQSLHDDFLRRLPDFQRLARKFQKKQGTGLQDVFRIYQAITRLPTAVTLLQQSVGSCAHVVHSYLLEPFEESVNNFTKFREMVESTIDLDAVHRRNEYLIRADFDDTLGDLKKRLLELEDSIEDEFRRSARKLNLEPGKTIKLETNDQYGYFMRVTLKEEKILREFRSFEVLDAQKGGVRFRNRAMSELNETHLEVKREYSEVQQTIVDEVVRIAAGYSDPLHQLNSTTALLDVIVSLAVAAISAPGGQYVRPKMLPRDNGKIIIRQLRHPCLEMQENVSVIPNDVCFERGKQIFLVITGPNMGGKSTYIRGVGVIVAMAQIGSFVPCDSAELCPVDSIMARVGAADYQIRGVSTFLAEMLETASVLKSATEHSLVIIDELGRGTSTYDGFGLAWAVASHLAGPDVGCFNLFATHFHELTSLERHLPGRVANLRVTAQLTEHAHQDGKDTEHANSEDRMVMLYKVEPGVCTRSYGLQVARLAGLPKPVIREAEQKACRDEQLESLWLKLDEPGSTVDKLDCPAKRLRIDNEPVIPKTFGAVRTADHLRLLLIDLLERSLTDQTLDDQGTPNEFGHSLADLVRSGLNKHSSELPVSLLLDLQS